MRKIDIECTFATTNHAPMSIHESTAVVERLGKERFSAHCVFVAAEAVQALFPNQPKGCRLIVTINHKHAFHLAAMPYGNGEFYIQLGTDIRKQLGLRAGEQVHLSLSVDHTPIDHFIPEVLKAVLEQDQDAAIAFEKLSDGKKRSFFYAINQYKTTETQIRKTLEFVERLKNGEWIGAPSKK